MRKLPKEVKGMGICQVLEEKMRSFKESIPLFADLKNDALRERYVNIVRVWFLLWRHGRCHLL